MTKKKANTPHIHGKAAARQESLAARTLAARTLADLKAIEGQMEYARDMVIRIRRGLSDPVSAARHAADALGTVQLAMRALKSRLEAARDADQ